MALSLRLGQFFLIGSDQFVCILLNGLIDCLRRSFHLRNLDIGLKIIGIIFIGTEGDYFGNGADHRDLLHGVCDSRVDIGQDGNCHHGRRCGHTGTFYKFHKNDSFLWRKRGKLF